MIFILKNIIYRLLKLNIFMNNYILYFINYALIRIKKCIHPAVPRAEL